MKKCLLLIFAFQWCFVSAQSNFELGVQSGPEVNFPSSPNKESVDGYVPLPGFNVGLRFRHNFGMHSFVWGLEYAQMKFNFRYPPNLYIDPTNYHPNKLSLFADQFRLPLLYQINIGKKKSQFFFNAGPCVLFAISSQYNDALTFGDDENTPIYPRQLIKDINMGLMTGMGYSYQPIPRLRLFTEARFTLPFFANDGNIRTLGLSWSLGVSFKTKK